MKFYTLFLTLISIFSTVAAQADVFFKDTRAFVAVDEVYSDAANWIKFTGCAVREDKKTAVCKEWIQVKKDAFSSMRSCEDKKSFLGNTDAAIKAGIFSENIQNSVDYVFTAGAASYDQFIEQAYQSTISNFFNCDVAKESKFLGYQTRRFKVLSEIQIQRLVNAGINTGTIGTWGKCAPEEKGCTWDASQYESTKH